MKTVIKYLTILFIGLTIVSCSDDNDITMPSIDMDVDYTDLVPNQTMTIKFTGDAQQIVVFTGDDTHDYDLRESNNTGFVVDKKLFTYSYTSPGTYKVVCLASNYGELGENMQRTVKTYTVTVTDDVTEINKLSCPQVLYDEVYAERMDNDNWLMRLPRKVKYRTSTPSISLSQKLKFYIESDSSKVYVNDVLYSNTAKYDLTNALKIKVLSNAGTNREYNLFTVNYPEFKSFKLLGVEGVLDRDAFDYSKFVYTVTLPQGTDISSINPVFTMTAATEKAYYNGNEMVSGETAVNFNDGATITLVNTMDGHPTYKADATVTVNVVFK